MRRVLSSIKEVLGFLRFDLSLFAAFVGVFGFGLFNPLSPTLILVALVSFLACGAGCAYNEIKDVKEDLINRGHVNPLTGKRLGLVIIAISYSLGLLMSCLISPTSVVLYSVMIFLGFTYSKYRLKKHILVKNFYSGFGSTLVFLIGASFIAPSVIVYYLMLSLFIFAGTIVSDLRDYKGDIKAGVRTIPIVVGYETGKRIVCVLLIAFLIFMHAASMYIFAPLSVFSLLIMALLLTNRPKPAHMAGGLSLLTMVGVLFI